VGRHGRVIELAGLRVDRTGGRDMTKVEVEVIGEDGLPATYSYVGSMSFVLAVKENGYCNVQVTVMPPLQTAADLLPPNAAQKKFG
jgi:hypothetical protein